MRYIFIFLSTLFFLGCSAKYKTVSEYILPTSESAKECLVECQKQHGSCKEICNANSEICKSKAYEAAKNSYEAKMQGYIARLEQYGHQLQMYELEMDLYYMSGFDGYYGYGYRRFYPPYRFLWMRPYPMIRPLKPSLDREFKIAEMRMCQSDCGCTKVYDECYLGCGGIIKDTEICVKNCP